LDNKTKKKEESKKKKTCIRTSISELEQLLRKEERRQNQKPNEGCVSFVRLLRSGVFYFYRWKMRKKKVSFPFFCAIPLIPFPLLYFFEFRQGKGRNGEKGFGIMLQ
jgi:hypothetical protein